MLHNGTLTCMCDNEICESIRCLYSTQLIITETPVIGWVQSLYLAAAPNQLSRALKAVTCLIWVCVFSPSTCQDTRSRRRDQNKPPDWSTACHQLMFARRTVLLKGQTQYLTASQKQYSMSSMFCRDQLKYVAAFNIGYFTQQYIKYLKLAPP